MRTLLTVLSICLLAGIAIAGHPPTSDPPPSMIYPCGGIFTHGEWDFTQSDCGFTPVVCDPTGGEAVWEWGPSTLIPNSYDNLWGTVLNANYPNNAGQGLLSPPFYVSTEINELEILHYVHTESNYDGGNVKVNGQVLVPMEGYPATISTSTSYYAYCVDMQEGFTGNGYSGASEVWYERCFDISAFQGQDIQVQFDFGSDSSVSYPGWYIARVRIVGSTPVAVEQSTWGQIKHLYD